MIRVTRETHETPVEVCRRLKQAGGVNLYGLPSYRVVWGQNRLSWIGGDWDQYDDHGNFVGQKYLLQQCPKYICTDVDGHITFDRWILEKWVPPEIYGSPRFWNYRELGPFPAEGEYELSQIIEGPGHSFVQITPSIVDYLVRRVEAGRSIDRTKRKLAIEKREAQRLKRDEDKMYDILSDTSPFFKGSYAVVPEMKEAYGGT